MQTQINKDIEKYSANIGNGIPMRLIVACLVALIYIGIMLGIALANNIHPLFVVYVGGIPAIGIVWIGVYKREGYYGEYIVRNWFYKNFKGYMVDFEADETEEIIMMLEETEKDAENEEENIS